MHHTYLQWQDLLILYSQSPQREDTLPTDEDDPLGIGSSSGYVTTSPLDSRPMPASCNTQRSQERPPSPLLVPSMLALVSSLYIAFLVNSIHVHCLYHMSVTKLFYDPAGQAFKISMPCHITPKYPACKVNHHSLRSLFLHISIYRVLIMLKLMKLFGHFLRL